MRNRQSGGSYPSQDSHLKLDLSGLKKPPLFLFVPRCGSTPIAILIGRWFEERRSWGYLGEYLNPLVRGYRDTGSGLDASHLEFLSEGRDPEKGASYSIEEIRKRLGTLKKFPGRQSLKLEPLATQHFRSDEVEWLLAQFSPIFISRKDQFQHLLSFIISMRTRHWYQEGGISVPEGGVLAERSDFDLFVSRVLSWEKFLKWISLREAPIILYYEDFLEEGPAAFLERIGLTGGFKKSPRLPEIQNPEDKSKRVQNIEEVRGWYDEVFRA